MENAVKFKRFGTMIDCSRNAVMNVPSLKKWIDILADLGYTTLLLYTEETYEVENQPFFGYLRGRYSGGELKELDDYACSKGIEVTPCIQTLAHLNQIFRWWDYCGINDCADILLAGDENTYKLIDDMFASISKSLRTKNVNIGMDEAHMIGRGKYFDINGLKDKSEILVDHLKRVAEIADKYGLKLTMWGDMFFRLASGGQYYVDDLEVSDEVKAKIPANVDLVYWDYYSTDYARYDKQIKLHNKIKDNCWFAGGLWTWQGFAPHNDYSMKATKAALSACRDNGVQNVFLTMWGDNGGECTPFMILPSLYYAAQIAKGETDINVIKNGFAEKYGIPFDTFMLLDLPGTPNWSDDIKNPDKYMLYNDCFMGIFDSTVRNGDAESYKKCAETLADVKENEYSFLFETMKALCEVLSLKFDIGKKTHAAYKAGREDVKKLLPVYDSLAEKTEEFYRVYRKQWMTVNKPHGFDVQDARLGGLICRIKNCRERLCDFADGRIDRIDELEEKLLNHYGNGPISYNSWGGAITANVV